MNLLLLLLVLGTAFAAQEFIDGEYLIALNEHADEEALVSKLKTDYSVDVKKAYHFTTLTIMLIKGDDADVERAAKLAEIKSIDRNMIYHTDQCESEAHDNVWGLDRTDQQAQLTYTNPRLNDATYEHGECTGSGVKAYVVDSGIDITHSAFQGRATWGTSAGSLGNTDDNGHGTHCAGTIGSITYGLAKESSLVAIKVLNAAGSGSTGDIVEGLQWVEADHINDGGLGEAKGVINMSIGGGVNPTMDAALQACIDVGVVGVVSAGNSDTNACNQSPAQLPDALTVGATEVTDITAEFTNYGTCVDIFAPGVDVLSTQPGEAEAFFSGTSMAAPHVCGVVARYLGSASPTPTPAETDAWLEANSTPDVIQFRAGHETGSPDMLLYGPCSGLMTCATPK